MNKLRALSLLAVLAVCSAAQADIPGFGNFSGFHVNQGDGASAPTLTPTGIHLTGASSGQARSVFYDTSQTIGQFTASFTYQATGTPVSGFGACFVIQNSGGPHRVADPSVSGIPTRFGYSDFGGTFHHSVAVSMEFASLGPGSSSSAVYHDANTGGGSSNTTPLNLFSGNPIAVTITYNGTLLSTHMVDTVSGAVFDSISPINIASYLGSTSGYIGFTASTNANTGTDQYISNFSFTSVPTPGSAALLALSACGLVRRRR